MKDTKASMVEVCEYILATRCTVRHAAEHFNLGKSTVHVYCQKCPDEELRAKVQSVLATNLAERMSRMKNTRKGRAENEEI